MHRVLVNARAVTGADVITADPSDMGIATDATGANSATKSSDMVASANPADMNASDRSTHMAAAKATNMRATAETADMRTTTKSAHMAAATKSATMPAAATTATATRVGGNGQKARSKKGRRQDRYHSFHHFTPQKCGIDAQLSQRRDTKAVDRSEIRSMFN
jgi:hypothetical protein